MQFLCGQFRVSLTEGTRTQTFALDLLQARPDFERITTFHQWSAEARVKMQEAIKRQACPVTWAAIVVDESGILLVLRFKQCIQPRNAKSAARCLMHCLPDQQQDLTLDEIVQKDLRPLDEVDKNRISSWKKLRQFVSQTQTRGL